jgi:2-C-methyl-D-erythritol 2,4-cyclodiphosphate synthase
MNYKVGIGYDIHRLVVGRKLILGGVKIPFVKGLLGHSDADVILHAVCDAILGAAGLGDIGEHFPDSDKKYKNISSIILLKDIVGKIKRKKLSLHNVDINIICQAPRLTDYKSSIRSNIAKILDLDKSLVNIKAKTNEGLGGIGSGEYIAAQAVVLLKQ